MTSSEVLFFDKNQGLLPLYIALRKMVLEKYGDEIKIKVSKTQISFSKRHIFLVVSIFKKKFMVTIGLPGKNDSSHIMQAVEAYPGRWTHHIIVEAENGLDSELMQLIDESYTFSEAK